MPTFTPIITPFCMAPIMMTTTSTPIIPIINPFLQFPIINKHILPTSLPLTHPIVPTFLSTPINGITTSIGTSKILPDRESTHHYDDLNETKTSKRNRQSGRDKRVNRQRQRQR